MGWSMDRQGIRTSFDCESRRLKQVELSGLRRERVSLHTYANELSAREAEVCQEAKYGEWREPTNAAPAAGRPFDRVETQVRKRQCSGTFAVADALQGLRIVHDGFKSRAEARNSLRTTI